MTFARSFFDLQLSFAESARELLGGSLEDALLAYTNLYVRLGFGRDFDPGNAGWQRYLAGLAGLRSASDIREWTYHFYLGDPEASTAPRSVATFGCFSYARPDETCVRLHFRNAAPLGHSPLARDSEDLRRSELAALLAHLAPRVSGDTPIRGASWLYNLEAYRRLFPPGYVASARPIEAAFRSMALWGQFLDRQGEVRKTQAERFMSAVARASTPLDLGGCFPLQPLATTAPVREFQDFFLVAC